MHHIVSDFWSMRVFMRELVALYEAWTLGDPRHSQTWPSSMPTLSTGSTSGCRARSLETHLAYWRQQLGRGTSGAASPHRPATPGGPELLWCDATCSCSRRLLPRRSKRSVVNEEVTLFVTLLAAFKTLLSHYAGQAHEIVVGAPIAGRTRVEVEGLIGYFLNTLALRTDLPVIPVFARCCSGCAQVVLAAYAHQELPFEKLVEALRPERSPHHMPVFQVVFNFQNVPLPTLELPGCDPEPCRTRHRDGEARFDSLYAYPGGRAGGDVGVQHGPVRRGDHTRHAGRFCDPAAQHMSPHPEARLGTLNAMLTHAERQAHMEQQHATNASNLTRLGRARRQAIRVSPARLIRTEPLQPGEPLPLLVQPALQEVDLTGWARSNLPGHRDRAVTARRRAVPRLQDSIRRQHLRSLPAP